MNILDNKNISREDWVYLTVNNDCGKGCVICKYVAHQDEGILVSEYYRGVDGSFTYKGKSLYILPLKFFKDAHKVRESDFDFIPIDLAKALGLPYNDPSIF